MIRSGALTVLLTTALSGLAIADQIELISNVPPQLASDTAGGFSYVYGGSSGASADGRYLVFGSTASNLVAKQKDANAGGDDVFLHDRLTGSTILVSHAADAPDTTGNGSSFAPRISADGRWVVFSSLSDDLVEGEDEESAAAGLYLYERETGTMRFVDRGVDSSISADGAYIAFVGTLEEDSHVFLFERSSGKVTLVSRSASSTTRPGNKGASDAVLSADGRFVAFSSEATDLVTGQNDPRPSRDVFLYDRVTGGMTLVSRSGASALTAGNSSTGSFSHDLHPSLSADGRFVAFSSDATNLVAGVPDDDWWEDVFLFDRLTGAMICVSRGGRIQGGSYPTISADGNAVAYLAYLNGDPGFAGGQVGVFDRLAGQSAIISRAAGSGSTQSNGLADNLSLSPNGRYVAFTSSATNLVPGQVDSKETYDTFLHDRVSGSTVLVSHAPGAPKQAAPDSYSLRSTVASDGSWVAFDSQATSLDPARRDANGQPDVFLFDRATTAVRTLSLHPPGMASRSTIGRVLHPAVSGDGRYVVFVHDGTGLFPGHVDTNKANDVFLYDRVAKKMTLVSRSAGSPLVSGNSGSNDPRISRDGNFVAFVSRSTNLVPGQQDSPDTFDVFLYNRLTGTVSLVSGSRGSATRVANGYSFPVAVTAGGIVLFSSHATDVIPGQQDQNAWSDLFLRAPRTQAATLITRTHNSATRTANQGGSTSFMTPDGAFVLFESGASDIAPPGQDTDGGRSDLFLFQRRTGTVTRIPEVPGVFDGLSPNPLFVSANGRYIAFTGYRTGFGARIMMLDRVTGEIFAASPEPTSNPRSWVTGLSDNGRFLLFVSEVENVIPGQEDTLHTVDTFLFDRVTRETRLISHAPDFPLRAVGSGLAAQLSADGRYVAFQSDAEELLTEPGRFGDHVYLFDRISGKTTLVDRPAPSLTSPFNLGLTEFTLSAFGGYVAFISSAADLVPGDFNGDVADVFLYIPGPPAADAALEKAAGKLTPVRSCTLLDTLRRKDGPALRSDVLKLVRAHVRKCGIPESAQAVSLQATIYQPTGQGNLRFYRGDLTAPSPPAAILRFQRGRTIARPVVVPVSEDCNVAVLPFVAGAGEAHVRLEVNGYYE
ncbi:MAG TPA: hypothetical protein VF789_07065 [Thermoanaerobaculia bacterium]